MAFTLPRLPTSFTPEQQQIWWQQVVEAIEAQENSQNDLITQLATAQAALATTQTRLKIGLSWTVPAAVMTATDAGSACSIIVADHVRIYGDGSQLAVAGRTITGLAYSTDFGVYYDDPNCTDQTPSYIATTIAAEAQNNFVPGRHRVGVVSTPASGGTDTSGGSLPPGGGGDPYNRYDILP